MRIATTQIYQRGVDSMLDQQARVFKTQLQLSSGQRLTSPADDPTAAAQILGFNESLAITGQYRTNAKFAQSRLDSEEASLRSVVDALQRARELAVRAQNDTNGATDRAAIAQEVRQIMDHVLSLANTRDGNGEYIFAGTRSLSPPFSHDGNGGFTYAGDQGQRLVQIGPTRQIAVSDSGLDVFMKIPNADGTGYQDVFSALYGMATELEANAPDADRITELDNAIENFLTVQARIGARQNAIDREDEVNSAYELRLEAARGNLRDVDMAEAATELNRQLIVLQAAQQSFVRIQGLSLFNYL